MARYYKVSADTSEKEKIFGGILTFGQLVALVAGLFIGIGMYMYLQKFFGYAAIVTIVFGLIAGGAFAFYKKNGLPLLIYMIYKFRFNANTKTLVNDLVYGKKFTPQDELFQ